MSVVWDLSSLEHGERNEFAGTVPFHCTVPLLGRRILLSARPSFAAIPYLL
jgi:hypothetical protein